MKISHFILEGKSLQLWKEKESNFQGKDSRKDKFRYSNKIFLFVQGFPKKYETLQRQLYGNIQYFPLTIIPVQIVLSLPKH